MALRKQRGLSLLWCAVLVGVLSVMAMGALFSMRYERNFFAQAWGRLTGAQLVQAVGNAAQPASATVQKCIVGGKVMYSNLECDAKNPTSRKVDLHDSRGIEAPKALPPVMPQADDAAVDLRSKMIEKAAGR